MQRSWLAVAATVSSLGILALLVIQVVWLPRQLERMKPDRPVAPAGADAQRVVAEKLDGIEFALQRLDEKLTKGGTVDQAMQALIERQDELGTQIYEFERDSRRDLMQLQENVLKKMRQLAASSSKERPKEPAELVRELASDGVELDLGARRITARGRLVSPKHPLELLAAAEGGPLHEALLELRCAPSALHAGLVALGAKVGGGADWRTRTQPHGTQAHLYLGWDGQDHPRRAESCVLDIRDDQPMTDAKWVFTGSQFETNFRTGEEYYVADEARVSVAIAHKFSHTAVISLDHADADNEHIWVPNAAIFPEVDELAVTLVVSLEPIVEWDMP